MLDDKIPQIEKFVSQQLNYWKVPGCIISVFTKNDIVFTKAFGVNNLDINQPMDTDLIFSIGSCKKSMTSAAVAKLVDMKKIEWNQPIRNYVPEFTMKSQFSTMFISIADILANRTNIGKNTLFWDFYPWKRNELLNYVREFECFENYNHLINYNNMMYSVAEYIIEYVTGDTFENFIKTNFWNKLNMNTSGFGLKQMLNHKNIINNYNYYNDMYHLIPYWTNKNRCEYNIYANIWDMVRWVQLYLNRGEKDGDVIVSYDNLYQSIIPQTMLPLKKNIYGVDTIASNKTFMFYGMGWFIQIYRGMNLLYHEGKEMGSNLYISYMPDKDLGIVLVLNREDYKIPHILSYFLYDLFVFVNIIDWHNYYKNNYIEKNFYHANMKIGKELFYKEQIDKYQGEYFNSILGKVTIYLKDNKLRLKFYELDVPLQKKGDLYIGVPDKEFICAKNRVGHDNGLYVKFEIKNESVTNVLIRNDDNLSDLNFEKRTI